MDRLIYLFPRRHAWLFLISLALGCGGKHAHDVDAGTAGSGEAGAAGRVSDAGDSDAAVDAGRDASAADGGGAGAAAVGAGVNAGRGGAAGASGTAEAAGVSGASGAAGESESAGSSAGASGAAGHAGSAGGGGEGGSVDEAGTSGMSGGAGAAAISGSGAGGSSGSDAGASGSAGGTCQSDQDCATGQICGLNNSATCSDCSTDHECQIDTDTYGPGFFCSPSSMRCSVLCASCGGCEQVQTVGTNNYHTTDPITYPDPPPTSGPHNPCWARWGVATVQVLPERWVHNLEHGGIVFLYNCPDGCATDIATLTDLVTAHDRTVLTEYDALPGRFAVVAWGHRLVTSCVDPVAFAKFYTENFDHGSESESDQPDDSCPPDNQLQ